MKFVLKNNVHKILAFVLAIVMFISVLGISDITSYAYDAKTGMVQKVNSSGVMQTYESASTSASGVSKLVYGKPVTVINESTDASGVLWYQITYYIKNGAEQKTAFCQASNILLDEDASVIATGKINANSVSLWSCTGDFQKPELASLSNGTKVQIVDKITDDGVSWSRVKCTVSEKTYYGWVQAQYITEDSVPEIETDEEYEDYLLRIGFPESYVKSLAVLHEQYPNWVFNPIATGLAWETVIENEAYPGRNLVENSENDAKKSTDSRAYDWTTNTWTIYDSGRWVSAHPDFIAYCMDPRNFLNATNIFMFESLNFSEAHNAEGVNSIIKNTFMATQIDNGDGTMLDYTTAFMTIGKEANVSPYHLASRVYQEQGKGTSSLISGTYSGYEGYYNYFNIKATGSTSAAVIANGLTYAKNQGWNTRYKSLLGGANFIAKSYIGVGQNTLYFQKFDVIAQGGLYTHQYMQNVQAAISEGKKVANGYTDKQQAFVFNIPVYNNMPEEAVKFTASGNRNNYLSDITVSGQSLTPTFSGDTTEYSLNVENAVSSISVSATAVVSASTVSGTGTLKVNEGLNTYKILCKSQSGDTKTYTLTVNREASSVQPETPKDATWTSDKYTIGTYVTGVNPGTSASDFLAGFQTENCTLKLLNASGEENTSAVATGDKIAVYVDDTLLEAKEIVVYGDVSGDGKINALDAIKLNRYTIGTTTLTGCYLVAADVSGDGKSNALDAIIINRYTIGTAEIKQR